MTTTGNSESTSISKVSQRNYNNVTLKTLTAYQLMAQRENMCELFQLLDDSERHNRIVDVQNQKEILEDMKRRLEQSKDLN
ncbi:Htl1p TDEL_0B05660 [Torulaspora delbrueckii]|uniref:Uncharacterized protein n=1 Tax=Torulaspora delbrueckii TaxID=4950 RepID=G8ZQ01_TORDE|nr:hypothetical protein TDEL_0B05660 [Torulaspora delbrueckii]CCE90695.1 hypothetical protein TDEL_0B05660 [Torulaspora delbrueckii]